MAKGKNNKNSELVSVIILAAGLGKRMKSPLPKVLTPLMGAPMINYILQSATELSPSNTVLVVGHKGELVVESVKKDFDSPDIIFTTQTDQKGTGHATQIGITAIKDFIGTIIIMPGDVPLIDSESLESLLRFHLNSNATVSFLSFEAADPTGYGRVTRDGDFVTGIVEEKDCSPEQRKILEVNSGIYAVDSAFLFQALQNLKPNNNQGELYLTDIIGIAVKEGQHVRALKFDEGIEFLGVNSQTQLSFIERLAMDNKIHELLESGVYMKDPTTVYVDYGVEIGEGSKIGPNTQLLGSTKIGKNVTIEGSAYIVDAIVEDDVVIKFGTRIEAAKIGKESQVGPFAHLRPEAKLDRNVKIGNFVEVKKTHLKEGAKASHLTYLGDAEVGKEANIGAGTITCNFDGHKKSKTTIGDHVFIGSNTALVAPVTINKGAVVGAGSVITKDVSADALAIERTEQREISGWAKKRKR